MPDFKSLLSKPVDDIKKPPALPAGTYSGRIDKYELKESREKKTPYLQVDVKLSGPGADIDPSELEGIDLNKKNLSRNFFLTEDAQYRLVALLHSCGIDTRGRSLGESIPDLLQAEVIVSVTQRASEDGKDIYNDVNDLKGTAGV
jgi:hypothetical protein